MRNNVRELKCPICKKFSETTACRIIEETGEMIDSCIRCYQLIDNKKVNDIKQKQTNH